MWTYSVTSLDSTQLAYGFEKNLKPAKEKACRALRNYRGTTATARVWEDENDYRSEFCKKKGQRVWQSIMYPINGSY